MSIYGKATGSGIEPATFLPGGDSATHGATVSVKPEKPTTFPGSPPVPGAPAAPGGPWEESRDGLDGTAKQR